MSIAVDVLLLAVFALLIARGVKKGFVVSLFDLIGGLAAGIVAKLFSATSASFIYSSLLKQRIILSLQDNLNEIISSGNPVEKLDKLLSVIPEPLKLVSSNFGLDVFSEAELEKIRLLTDPVQIEAGLVEPIAVNILKIITFIIIFIIALLIVKLIGYLLDKIVNISPVKKANAVLGGILGFIFSLVVVFALCMTLSVIASIFKLDKFTQALDGSYIMSMMDSIASLTKIVEKITL